MNIFFSFLSGVIFSIGLIISGMTNPQKVIGFLDIFGDWDYALVFVMGGAVCLNLLTFKLIAQKEKPLYSSHFDWPLKKSIDKKLILGASLFGLGWGLVGICPGPGVVNLITLNPKVLVFVACMLVGMFIGRRVVK